MIGTKMVFGGIGFLLSSGMFLMQLGAQDSTTVGKARQQAGALQASILLQESGRKPKEMATDEMFYSGERFRLKLRSDRDGYLYIALRDAQGQTQLIYPTNADQEEENWIGRKQAQSVPARDFFRFDENAGTERVWVIVSPRRLADLDRVAHDGGELDSDTLQRHIGEENLEAKGIDRAAGADADPAGQAVLPLRIVHLPR